MSEAALAPKMGPVTEEERAAIEKWRTVNYGDMSLARSLDSVRAWERPATYILVRALRAGVPLEKLL